LIVGLAAALSPLVVPSIAAEGGPASTAVGRPRLAVSSGTLPRVAQPDIRALGTAGAAAVTGVSPRLPALPRSPLGSPADQGTLPVPLGLKADQGDPGQTASPSPLPDAPSSIVAYAPGPPGLRSDSGRIGLGDADNAALYFGCTTDSLCEEPPDPGVAVSATNIVEAVNEVLLVVDRADGAAYTLPLSSFFQIGPDQSQADPRVAWDPRHQRWLATEISWDCDHSYLHVAVSAGTDPAGAWNVYRLLFPGRLVDYPGLGTSDETVMVGLNLFGPDPAVAGCVEATTYLGTQLVVLDWSELEAAVPSLSATISDPDPALFTWRPALSWGGSAPTGHAIVGIDAGSDALAYLGYATISGTNAGHDVAIGTPVNLVTTLALGPILTPPAPAQPGDPPTIATAVDAGPTDAIAGPGRVAVVTTQPCRPAGDTEVHDCVRITEVTDGASPALISDSLLGEAQADLFMGGIGYSGDGTLHVVYSRSSASSFASTWATSRPFGAQAFRAPALVTPGEGTYSGARWGDWNILAADPLDPHGIWQAGEVPTAAGTWATWLSHLTPAEGPALAGGVEIEDGRALTSSPLVRLSLAEPPPGAVTVVRGSNRSEVGADGALVYGWTMPLGHLLSWSLTAADHGGRDGDGTRSVYLQWGDGVGGWSSVVSDEIVLDTHGPVGAEPGSPSLGSGSLAGAGVPVVVTWTAARDATSGVAGYDVRAYQDGHLLTTVSAGETARRATLRLPAGHRYRIAVRGVDRAGNAGREASAPEVVIGSIDDVAPAVTFGAGWATVTKADALGGSVHHTARAGATARIRFTARTIAIIAPTGPARGRFEVRIDGRSAGTVDLRSVRNAGQRIVFHRDLAAGAHVMTITAVDTAGRPGIDIDGFITLR